LSGRVTKQQGAAMKAESKAASVLAVLVLLSGIGFAQSEADQARPHRQVIVSIPDRKLAVVEEGHVLHIFAVSVGAKVSNSPTGEFQIINRVVNPAYYHPGTVIAPGKDNPVGTRWIGLDKKGYGIHGTNEPWSIGKAASHGCIRLRNRDVERLFTMLHVGDTVEIRGERDQQTAAVFGGEFEPAVTMAQSATTATPAGGQ
jgi:lipoprotein-anchoring transpeptidase ErfK/SrfK